MPSTRDLQRSYEIWRNMGWSVLKQKVGKRLLGQGYWSGYSQEAMVFSTWMDFSPQHLDASQKVQRDHAGPLDIQSMLWFLPEFDHAYYGGIYTLLRFADGFKRKHGVSHHFAILGNKDEAEIAAKIGAAFPGLAGEPVSCFNLYEHMADLPETDVAVATLWGTAYFALRYNNTKRKFYFMQDYEPLFYPAGSIFGQVEATYRFGFYGIANTPTIQQIYQEQYGGQAQYFLPCVDTEIFHPGDVVPQEPLTVFFYGRPGHPRNGFELGAQALRLLKKRMGSRLQVLAAGDRWEPKDFGLKGVVENLGLLSYQETADLYRRCHAGLVMMFTRHPSYLPFELMASGSLVVTNYNPATTWLLEDRQNCRLSQISATSFAETLEEALTKEAERRRISANAVRQIHGAFSDWEGQIEKIYRYMRDPQARQNG